MFIVLNQTEMAILTLQLNIMNKSIKKGLKRNYGKNEAKNHIEIFNQIKEYLNEIINKEDQEFMLVFSPDQYNFLHYFLSWYLEELELQAESDGDKNEFKEILAPLKEVHKKVFLALDELQRVS